MDTEVLVMPLDLSNAQSTFQAAMNDILRAHLCKFVLMVFDDIIANITIITRAQTSKQL